MNLAVAPAKWKGNMLGYFDIHSHILPGVDDGAVTMEETRKMLLLAYEEGIRVIIATPHFIAGKENIAAPNLKEIYEQVIRVAAEITNEFQILLGNELYYNTGLINALNEGTALTIDGTRYILVEFAPWISFRELWEGLNNCIFAGYIPILAHTERYDCLVKDLDSVKDLINLGAYIQLNFSCITSRRFDSGYYFCRKLLHRGWVHFLGTDAHGARGRTVKTKKAVSYIRRKYGEDMIKQLLWENPLMMIEGGHLKI
jgi:protein-tyrosine phosphatase